MNNSCLRKLGIFGWDNIEDFLLASLVTGDGVLFVGGHGTAKTYCAEIIAQAMAVKFQKVDASKAEFEDYLGFPNPKALSEGKFEYVATPLTIVNKQFVFVDEINRCKPHTQNKLLELIYNRQFYGQPTEVTWIWAAMNIGDEYIGTEPLDPAFAGRFAFIIPVPETVEMEFEDMRKVCYSEASYDAPALKKRWNNQPVRTAQKKRCKLLPLVEKSARLYKKADREHGEIIDSILVSFAKIWWKEKKDKIDGRRLSMMRRAITSFLSVRMAKEPGFIIKPQVLLNELNRIMPYILPHLALGKELDFLQLQSSLAVALKSVEQSDQFLSAYFSNSPVVKMKVLCGNELSLFARRKLLNDILKPEEEGPLAAIALAPFALMNNSRMTGIEKGVIVQHLKKTLQRLQSQGIVVTDLKDVEYFGQTLKNMNKQKIVALCQFHADWIARKRKLSSESRELLVEKYLKFFQNCISTLKPIYERCKAND